MTQPTKPSAGALKAARAIVIAIGDSFRVEPLETVTVEKAAHIIDRETGVAELLKTVEDVLNFGNLSADNAVLLRLAIANAESERSEQVELHE